jgi:hypothetical protein
MSKMVDLVQASLVDVVRWLQAGEITTQKLVCSYLGQSYLACLLEWASADGEDVIEKDNIKGRGHRAVFETLDRQLGESCTMYAHPL